MGGRGGQFNNNKSTNTKSGSSTYNAFLAMNDDDKADVIAASIEQGVPDYLADNDFQRLLYNLNANDKPKLVSDAVLDKMDGEEIFRTVNAVNDSTSGINYSADLIAEQVLKGDSTRVSGDGASFYGRGIYFADNQYGASAYGKVKGDVKQTAQIRGKLNANARVMRYDKAQSGVNAEINSGSKLGKVLSRMDTDSRVSAYALAKGYNVIQDNYGQGYYAVLNRTAVTMSKSINSI